jgi:hypothetical protein
MMLQHRVYIDSVPRFFMRAPILGQAIHLNGKAIGDEYITSDGRSKMLERDFRTHKLNSEVPALPCAISYRMGDPVILSFARGTRVWSGDAGKTARPLAECPAHSGACSGVYHR